MTPAERELLLWTANILFQVVTDQGGPHAYNLGKKLSELLEVVEKEEVKVDE